MKIKLLIVDDKSTIRDSLKILFQPINDIEVVAFKENALGIEDWVQDNEVDLVLMDIDMPGINGIEAVNRIRNKKSLVPIIMLTVFEDEDKIFRAIKAGANGYLIKNVKPSKIIEAVRDVFNGGASFTPAVAKKVISYFQQPKMSKNKYNLTKRELEVLSHLVKGRQYRVIGEQLNISYETVRSHMKNIYRKIHVTTLTEVIVKTLKEKLLE